MMKKRRIYLFSLWMATCSLLLSSVILHHHHFNSICFVEERCAHDGNINDEHTEHHEPEHEGCSVSQMHHFLLNAKVVKSIRKHIFDGSHALMAVLPSSLVLYRPMGLVVVLWQHYTSALVEFKGLIYDRRGPPCFFVTLDLCNWVAEEIA